MRDDIIAYYDAGISLTKIGKKYGHKGIWVTRYLERIGVKPVVSADMAFPNKSIMVTNGTQIVKRLGLEEQRQICEEYTDTASSLEDLAKKV